MKQKDIIKVAFVEDDKWVREQLVSEISKEAGFECTGSYPTAEAALAALPGKQPPDVAVLDINLPGINGIECLRRMKLLCPATRFLMLTAYEESESIFQALQAGANGYLLKRTGSAELLDSIRQVREGGSPMSSAIARRVVQYFNQMGSGASEMARLTAREREVLEFLARGGSYKEIAGKLSLSIETIRMNVKHIYTKLQVHSRGEAVAKYLRRP
jgi:DNA-binding NarL/FixJ family response regulator